VVGTVALPIAAGGNNLPFASSGSATSEGSLSLSAAVTRWRWPATRRCRDGVGCVVSVGDREPRGRARRWARQRRHVVGAAGRVQRQQRARRGQRRRHRLLGRGRGGQHRRRLVRAAGRARPASRSRPTGQRALAADLRQPALRKRQLGAFVNVFTIGTGLPQVAGQLNVSLPGMPTTGSSSPYAYVFFDLDPTVAGNDTLYVADDRAAASGGGVQKWTLANGIWTLGPTFNVAVTPNGFRGLAGTLSAAGPRWWRRADAVPPW